MCWWRCSSCQNVIGCIINIIIIVLANKHAKQSTEIIILCVQLTLHCNNTANLTCKVHIVWFIFFVFFFSVFPSQTLFVVSRTCIHFAGLKPTVNSNVLWQNELYEIGFHKKTVKYQKYGMIDCVYCTCNQSNRLFVGI